MENEALTMAVPETDTQNQIVVYQPNGVMKIDVRFDGETVWLLQSQIAELFSCSLENVRLHLKNIYAEDELSEEATAEFFSVVQKEGSREVNRRVKCYNLDAIIAVGYRVNSKKATKFRQWATRHLSEYLVKGFTMDDERLKNPDGRPDYFDELLDDLEKEIKERK